MDGIDQNDLQHGSIPGTPERATTTAEADDPAAALRSEVAAATAAYRELLVAANPGIPPALITGETVGALQASVEAAREIVDEVRRRNQVAAPVPGGSAQRAQPNLEGLRGAAKIQAALRQADS